MGGYEPTWDDLRMPAVSINPPGAVSDPDRDTVDPGLLFDPGTSELVHIIAQMPHSWIEGSEIRPHVHWSPTSTDTGSVVWQLEYQVQNSGDVLGAYTTITVTQAASGVSGEQRIALFPAVPMTGFTLSAIVMCRLSRLATDGADTYTDDARLIEFDIHYQIDGLGSISMWSKNRP